MTSTDTPPPLPCTRLCCNCTCRCSTEPETKAQTAHDQARARLEQQIWEHTVFSAYLISLGVWLWLVCAIWFESLVVGAAVILVGPGLRSAVFAWDDRWARRARAALPEPEQDF